MSQQRRGPTRAPMRGRGGPRKPPMGSGGGNQQNFNQQRSRGGGGGRGRGRGRGGQRGGYQQRNYGAGYSGGYQNNQADNQTSQQTEQQQSGVSQTQTMNTDNQQQSGQQQGGQQRKPRSRPPMQTQNKGLYEQFNAPPQQSGQQNMGQQNMGQSQQQNVEPVVPSNQQQPMASVQDKEEEKAVTEQQVTSGGGGAPELKQENMNETIQPKRKPIVQQKINRQPPWLEFTGNDKSSPALCGWAHRVRQVLSADTLRIALLKPRNRDALMPPDIIQITLDGIVAPRCQRWDPSNADTDKNKGGKGKKGKKNKNKNKGGGGDNKQGTKGGDDKGGDNDAPQPAVYEPPTKDEPFAYAAREFVRNKILNKNIFYAVWNTNSAQTKGLIKYWGDIYYQENKHETKSLTKELVAAGYAQLKKNSYLSDKEKEKLEKAQANAEKNGLGIWSKSDKERERSIRDIKWIPWEKQSAFGEKYKGKTLRGIVDQVISGSTIRVELLVNEQNNEFKNVVVNIAGVNAPKVPQQQQRGGGGGGKGKYKPPFDPLSRPFGIKAREWTEERLLGQIVDIKILFVSNKQIIAQTIHEKGRIGPSLLKKGLAQYEKWTAKQCDPEEQKLLLAATEYAKIQQLNIYGVIEEKPSHFNKNEQRVVVVQIISGDTVVVEDPKGRQERYTLSSIRAPRLGTRGGYAPKDGEQKEQKQEQKKQEQQESPSEKQGKRKRGGRNRGGNKTGQRKDGYSSLYATPDEYLAREAKELVRQKCIGRQVRLICEYSRALPQNAVFRGGPTEKKFASVYVLNEKTGKEENIALELIKRGYAELVWHSKNESNRSEDYALLEEAFNEARKQKIGLNGFLTFDKNRNLYVPDTKRRENKAKETAIKDFSGIEESAIKTHELIALNQFLTSGEVGGVVEFVFGANRVKVFIPSRQVCIAVRLADIRCGLYTLDSGSQKDRYREEAKKYLNKTILQRDIILKITSTGQDQTMRGRGRGGRGRGSGKGGTQATRNPNLDGHIYYKGKNVSEYLLENGLASVIMRRYQETGLNARQRPPDTFFTKEKFARDNKIGMWKEYNDDNVDDAKNDQQRQQRIKNSKTGVDVEVVVSHIESATLFYVNDANSDAMQNMNKEMEKLAKSKPKPPSTIRPGKSVKYAAKYDGYYARARVNNRDKRQQQQQQQQQSVKKEEQIKDESSKWFVMFVDYGNRASLSRTQFAPLPSHLRLDQVPALAMKCELAGISVYRANERAFNDAGYFFSSYAFHSENQKLRMKILYDDQFSKTWYVELFVGDKSINQLIAREGFVTLVKDRDLPRPFVNKSENGEAWSDEHKLYVKQYFDAIKANISLAKDEHKNIWYHGDVESAEEDNYPDPQSQKKGNKSRR